MCAAVRAEHNKRSVKESRARRKKTAEEQGPKSVGDMVVKGTDEKGRLRYAWNDIEVLATPREKREPLAANASKILVARAKESTQERALR